MKEWITAYKGFNTDLTCSPGGIPFQYEEGKTYTEDSCKLCEKGFHACEAPIDMLRYYPPNKSVYHKVELNGVCRERKGDTKICGTEIRIGERISLADIAKLQVEYVRKNCTNENNSVYGEPVTAGDYGVATAGNCGAATAGYRGAAAAGDYGAATSRGSITVGENGVGTVRGDGVKIRGGIGALLVIAEEKEDSYDIVSRVAGVVDGEKIKADTWYCVKDGKFVEEELKCTYV